MIVSAIVAVGENGEIGRGGELPWPHLKQDMRWFVARTKGKVVVMGRKTWDSLPESIRPLEGRTNLIVSKSLRGPQLDDRSHAFAYPWAALDHAEACGHEEAVVIGGAQIYAALWNRLSRVYLTKVEHRCPDADAFFPYPLPVGEWREEPAHDRWFVDPASRIRMGFYIYRR